jgi:xanthine dehydrogenase YagS FAD-binding subunit
MNSFQWADAKSIEDAISLLSDSEDAKLKAGGIDLLDLMKEHVASPRRVINIRNIKGLDHIRMEQDGALRIGPLATLAQIEADAVVRERFAALGQAAGRAATPQVRNMATIGGNILQRPRCWYFRSEHFPCRKKGGERCYAQDGENQYHAIFNNGLCAIVHPSAVATPLVAMNASLEITGPGGKREVALEKFLTPPNVNLHRENSLADDELVTEIRVPALANNARSAYLKQGEKESFDWPIAEVAAVLEMDGNTCRHASIILGAAAPVPYRARAAEDALRGQNIDEQRARDAAHAALTGAAPLSDNGYKIPVFEAIVSRTILAAVAMGGGA